MADGKYKCAHCEGVFAFHRKKKFCSVGCREIAHARKNGVRAIDEFKAELRLNAKSRFTCVHCGAEAFRFLGGSNIKKGLQNKYCSRECYTNARKSVGAEKAESRFKKSAIRKIASLVARIAKQKAREASRLKPCLVCCQEFEGVGQKKYCSDKCSRASESFLSGRRKAKATRRARIRGAERQPVDPIKVFERDGWRCRICRSSTPRRLRGTTEPDAPELDHIVPLAAGGSHTWENLQCLCRDCNIGKGAKPLGQGFLFGFAYV